MPEVTISSRRSQLGRARNVGSAKTGTDHWKAERLTAIALVPLTLWFVWSMIRLAGAPYDVAAHWAGRPWNAVLLLALIAMTFRHLSLGIRVVLEDYVTHKWFMTGGIIAIQAVSGLLGLTAALAVLKLALR